MHQLLEPYFDTIHNFFDIILTPIAPFLEFMTEDGLTNLFLLATSYAAILAAVLILFHFCCKSIIAPRYFKLMWILIGLRLAIPFAPETSFSFFNLFYEGPTVVEAQPFQADPERTLTAQVIQGSPFPALEPVLSQTSDVLNKDGNEVYAIFFVLAVIIWLLGGIFFLIQPVIANWRMNRRFQIFEASTDHRLISILKETTLSMNCKRWVPIIITDQIPFPALMGWNFPRILLPTDIAETYSDDELRMIFTHELAHLKRRDIALNWVLAMIRVVHWINPLFWFVSSKIKKFGELTCDADVLKTLGADKFRSYGDTLIKVAQRNPACKRAGLIAPVGLTGILSQKRNHKFLKSRIEQLKYSKQPQTRKRMILGWAIIASFVCVGMTNSAVKELDPNLVPKPSEHLYPHPIPAPKYVPQQSTSPYKIEESISLNQKEESISDNDLVIVYVVEDLIGKNTDKEKTEVELDKLKTFLLFDLKIKKVKLVNQSSTASYVALTSEGNHKKIRERLQYFRKHGWRPIFVNPTIISIPEDQSLKIKKKFYEEAETKKTLNVNNFALTNSDHKNINLKNKWAVLLNNREVQNFISIAKEKHRAYIMANPTTGAPPTHSSSMSTRSVHHFVVGITEGKDKNNKKVNKPVFEKFYDGMSITMRPEYISKKGIFNLDFDFSLTQITDIKSRTLKPNEIPVKSTGQKLTVQVPKIFSSSLSGKIQFKKDQTVLVATGIKKHKDREIYILFKCEDPEP
jgi:bla regulator protein blaR1